MSRRWLFSAVVLATVASARPSETARAAHTAASPQGLPVFSAEAELVVVHVTVADRRGAYVSGLSRDAFSIFEDGKPQSIDLFSGEDSPVTVGLVVDSSGSMREGRERVIAAATVFAQASHPNDEIFALAFNEQVRTALPPSAPFTSDANVLGLAVARAINAHGRTAMYDAVSSGLAYVAKGSHPRRVLVVVSDGGDNASATSFDHVYTQAQASTAAIYTVGVVDPLERDANPRLLRRLAHATGGESFFPRKVNDVEDVLRHIARDIRNTYTLGYVPRNALRDGRFRRLRVVVTDPHRRSLVVRSRAGYLASGPRQRR